MSRSHAGDPPSDVEGEAATTNPLSVRHYSSSRASSPAAPATGRSRTSDADDLSSELTDDSEDELVDRDGGGGRRGSGSRSTYVRGSEKSEQVMHSFGKCLLNKVTLHGLHADEESEKTPLTDLEAQAANHRQKRGSWWTPLPTAHKALIGCCVLLCVVLATVGIVVGVIVARHTAERSALEKADPGSQLETDEKWIAAQGAAAQAGLGAHSATDTTAAPATTGVSHYAGGPFTPFVSPVEASETPLAESGGSDRSDAVYSRFPELQALLDGNRNWQGNVSKEEPQFIPTLAQGQHPRFAYLGCADSRVAETSILAQKPGEIFVTRNIGNEYLVDDLSSETFISYAVAHVGVQHIIVMGHTKCGAVQAAITSPSKEVITNMDETRIDQWIRPIRSLFATTNRTEIVAFREALRDAETIEAKDVTDDVLRALVEENVKINVQRLAQDSSVQHAWYLYEQQSSAQSAAQPTASSAPSTENNEPALLEPLQPLAGLSRRAEDKKQAELWIHGWVYDVETGLVRDLGVSVGPEGPLVSG